jgi:MtrB/PioB family decaheme-associated outer membrane protein
MRASRKLWLAGAALGALVVAAPAAWADDLPMLASQDAYGGWTSDHGSLEAGGQVFINKPGASPSDNLAKFEEFGNQTDAVFLRSLDFGFATRDGTFTAEVMGKNITQNDQALRVDLDQPGQQYLTLGWYKSPQLVSTTAQTIFGGMGTNNLTVPDGVVQDLYAGISNGGNMYTEGAGKSVTDPFTTPNPTYPATATNPATSLKVPKGCYLGVGVQGTYNSVTNPTGCVAGVPAVATTIAGAEHGVTLGLQRDRKEIDYRWTPTEDWDLNVQYSNEHRWGLQEQGMLFSSSTSTPMAAVPAPVDDTTQDASISAEYSGYSPWGMRWNGMLKYDLSLYTDAFSSFTATNPFGGPGSDSAAGAPDCPVASGTTTPNCYGVGQMGMPPNNASNSIMAMTGVDLPWFKSSRYMGTFEYNAMTQNEAFIPMTINPNGNSNLWPTTSTSATTALAAMPRNSLEGQIDTLLFNNVLTTQFTSDLKNKLSYRYFSDDNTTPALTLQNFIINDSQIAIGPTGVAGGVDSGSLAPHTTLFSSYVKQNAADELTWDPVKWANLGFKTAWEQYDYSQYAANQTNEYTEKLYGDLTPTDWLTIRASDSIAWRRYDNYNWQSYVGDQIGVLPGWSAGSGASSLAENPLLADVNIANRNRNLANLFVDISTPFGLTLTPTASLRWDDYPTDPNLLAAANAAIPVGATPGSYQLGLRSDHNWTLGLEADYKLNSAVTLMGSYMYERTNQTLLGDSSNSYSTSTAGNTALGDVWFNNMAENVNTWTAAADFTLIPDRLALKLSGSYEIANDSWGVGPEPTCTVALSSSCGVANAINPAYPPEKTTLYHADATLSYKVDPAMLAQVGTKAEVFLKLHYMWEESSVTNWQNNATSVYMYSTLNPSTVSLKDMIFMAGDNPNYNTQLLMASLVVKW